jgi:hypothetical protein
MSASAALPVASVRSYFFDLYFDVPQTADTLEWDLPGSRPCTNVTCCRNTEADITVLAGPVDREQLPYWLSVE